MIEIRRGYFLLYVAVHYIILLDDRASQEGICGRVANSKVWKCAVTFKVIQDFNTISRMS